MSQDEKMKELLSENEQLKKCLQSVGTFEKEMHDDSLRVAKDIVQRDRKAVANIILNMKFGNMSNVSFCEIFSLKPGGCESHQRCTDCIHDFLTKTYRPIVEESSVVVGQLADFILKDAHFFFFFFEMKCECGFKEEGCKECLIKNAHLLNRPRED